MGGAFGLGFGPGCGLGDEVGVADVDVLWGGHWGFSVFLIVGSE